MSNNISVPASFVRDNFEQAGTFGQINYYRPGGFIQNPGSIQSFDTTFPSPHDLPSNYGSITQSIHHSDLDSSSESLTYDEDFLRISFTNNNHNAMWKNSVASHNERQMNISEHASLVRTDSKYV